MENVNNVQLMNDDVLGHKGIFSGLTYSKINGLVRLTTRDNKIVFEQNKEVVTLNSLSVEGQLVGLVDTSTHRGRSIKSLAVIREAGLATIPVDGLNIGDVLSSLRTSVHQKGIKEFNWNNVVFNPSHTQIREVFDTSVYHKVNSYLYYDDGGNKVGISGDLSLEILGEESYVSEFIDHNFNGETRDINIGKIVHGNSFRVSDKIGYVGIDSDKKYYAQAAVDNDYSKVTFDSFYELNNHLEPRLFDWPNIREQFLKSHEPDAYTERHAELSSFTQIKLQRQASALNIPYEKSNSKEELIKSILVSEFPSLSNSQEEKATVMPDSLSSEIRDRILQRNIIPTFRDNDTVRFYDIREKHVKEISVHEWRSRVLDIVEFELNAEPVWLKTEWQFDEAITVYEGNEFATTNRIYVDGIERWVVNNYGSLIHPTKEGVINFWRWFGDSKVVDSTGKPIITYHGTSAEFNTFNENNRGIYFSSDAIAAETFSKIREGAPRVIPAYLSIQNPWTLVQYDEDFPNSQKVDQSVNAVKDNGYDGIYRDEDNTWIALAPTQIKSAMGNSGLFNSESSDYTDSTNFKQDLAEVISQPVFIQGFHGSEHKFEEFKLSEIGTFGQGVYFTNEQKDALVYGVNIYRCSIQLKNPWIINVDPDSDGAFEYDIDHPAVEAILDLKGGERLLIELKNSGKLLFDEKLTWLIKDEGHDGVIATYPDGSMEIVAFDTSALSDMEVIQQAATANDQSEVGEVMNIKDSLSEFNQSSINRLMIDLAASANASTRAKIIASIDKLDSFPESLATVSEFLYSLAGHYEVMPHGNSATVKLKEDLGIKDSHKGTAIRASKFESYEDQNFQFYNSQYHIEKNGSWILVNTVDGFSIINSETYLVIKPEPSHHTVLRDKFEDITHALNIISSNQGDLQSFIDGFKQQKDDDIDNILEAVALAYLGQIIDTERELTAQRFDKFESLVGLKADMYSGNTYHEGTIVRNSAGNAGLKAQNAIGRTIFIPLTWRVRTQGINNPLTVEVLEYQINNSHVVEATHDAGNAAELYHSSNFNKFREVLNLLPANDSFDVKSMDSVSAFIISAYKVDPNPESEFYQWVFKVQPDKFSFEANLNRAHAAMTDSQEKQFAEKLLSISFSITLAALQEAEYVRFIDPNTEKEVNVTQRQVAAFLASQEREIWLGSASNYKPDLTLVNGQIVLVNASNDPFVRLNEDGSFGDPLPLQSLPFTGNAYTSLVQTRVRTALITDAAINAFDVDGDSLADDETIQATESLNDNYVSQFGYEIADLKLVPEVVDGESQNEEVGLDDVAKSVEENSFSVAKVKAELRTLGWQFSESSLVGRKKINASFYGVKATEHFIDNKLIHVDWTDSGSLSWTVRDNGDQSPKAIAEKINSHIHAPIAFANGELQVMPRNLPDVSYRTDGIFTTFFPNTTDGENIFRAMAADTEGTGKVLSIHAPAVIQQIKEAGYTIEQSEQNAVDTDELYNELFSSFQQLNTSMTRDQKLIAARDVINYIDSRLANELIIPNGHEYRSGISDLTWVVDHSQGQIHSYIKKVNADIGDVDQYHVEVRINLWDFGAIIFCNYGGQYAEQKRVSLINEGFVYGDNLIDIIDEIVKRVNTGIKDHVNLRSAAEAAIVLPKPSKARDGSANQPIEIDPENLAGLGIAQIKSIGNENIYAEKDQLHYFSKVMNTQDYARMEWDFVSNPQGNKDIANNQHHSDFMLYSIFIIEKLKLQPGSIDLLLRFSNRKTLDAFIDLPINDQANAYVRVVDYAQEAVEVPENYNDWLNNKTQSPTPEEHTDNQAYTFSEAQKIVIDALGASFNNDGELDLLDDDFALSNNWINQLRSGENIDTVISSINEHLKSKFKVVPTEGYEEPHDLATLANILVSRKGQEPTLNNLINQLAVIGDKNWRVEIELKDQALALLFRHVFIDARNVHDRLLENIIEFKDISKKIFKIKGNEALKIVSDFATYPAYGNDKKSWQAAIQISEAYQVLVDVNGKRDVAEEVQLKQGGEPTQEVVPLSLPVANLNADPIPVSGDNSGRSTFSVAGGSFDDVRSEQYQRYLKYIQAECINKGLSLPKGIEEKITLDERLEDGEAEELLAIAAGRLDFLKGSNSDLEKQPIDTDVEQANDGNVINSRKSVYTIIKPKGNRHHFEVELSGFQNGSPAGYDRVVVYSLRTENGQQISGGRNSIQKCLEWMARELMPYGKKVDVDFTISDLLDLIARPNGEDILFGDLDQASSLLSKVVLPRDAAADEAEEIDYPKWTLPDAEAFLESIEDVLAEHGLAASIVGGVINKEGERKDADIVLRPLKPMTFVQAHEAIMQFVPMIGGGEIFDAKESFDREGNYFVPVILSNDKYVEFWLDEKLFPFPADVSDSVLDYNSLGYEAGRNGLGFKDAPREFTEGNISLWKEGVSEYYRQEAEAIKFINDQFYIKNPDYQALVTLKEKFQGAFTKSISIDIQKILDRVGNASVMDEKKVVQYADQEKSAVIVGKNISQPDLASQNKDFNHWFGESKVADDQGNPLVVYHGTGAEFIEFDINRSGQNYHEGEHAFFFTDRKQSADNYAELHAGENGTPRTISAYLNIKNPYIESAVDYWGAVEKYDSGIAATVFSLQASGHDGVIIKSPSGSLYVAFDASQIKFAIDSFTQSIEPELAPTVNGAAQYIALDASQDKPVNAPQVLQGSIDHYADDSLKLTISDIGLGLIAGQNVDIALVGGYRSGNSSAGTTRLRYSIQDNHLHSALIESGKSSTEADEGCTVGEIELFVTNGTRFGVTGLVNLEINKEHRQKGYARKVVNSIVATTGADLKIYDIKKHYASVWKKLGVTQFFDIHGNALVVSKARGTINGNIPAISPVLEATQNIVHLESNVPESASSETLPSNQNAWQLTCAEYVDSELKKNPYYEDFKNDPEIARGIIESTEQDWRNLLQIRAVEGRISDVSLNDWVRLYGVDSLRVFRGTHEKGVEGYTYHELVDESDPLESIKSLIAGKDYNEQLAMIIQDVLENMSEVMNGAAGYPIGQHEVAEQVFELVGSAIDGEVEYAEAFLFANEVFSEWIKTEDLGDVESEIRNIVKLTKQYNSRHDFENNSSSRDIQEIKDSKIEQQKTAVESMGQLAIDLAKYVTGRNVATEMHIRFASAYIQKDPARLKYIANGCNEKSLEYFAKLIGIEKPTNSESALAAINEWAGISPVGALSNETAESAAVIDSKPNAIEHDVDKWFSSELRYECVEGDWLPDFGSILDYEYDQTRLYFKKLLSVGLLNDANYLVALYSGNEDLIATGKQFLIDGKKEGGLSFSQRREFRSFMHDIARQDYAMSSDKLLWMIESVCAPDLFTLCSDDSGNNSELPRLIVNDNEARLVLTSGNKSFALAASNRAELEELLVEDNSMLDQYQALRFGITVSQWCALKVISKEENHRFEIGLSRELFPDGILIRFENLPECFVYLSSNGDSHELSYQQVKSILQIQSLLSWDEKPAIVNRFSITEVVKAVSYEDKKQLQFDHSTQTL